MKRMSLAVLTAMCATILNPTHAQEATVKAPADAPVKPPAVDLAAQPTLYVVGYAHLDTQWRWCYPITIRQYIADTLHDNFALIEKYPSYIFNFSGSRRYQMMKEYYPKDYEKLKQYISAGRWFPCGSSVDECDANVPSAESLVRQVLYGNRYFRREFGVASDEFMLPDCFGFPAALPSVLAHCGIKGFSTQKLTWGSAVPIPFKVGVWEGPDGSSVIAALDPGPYVGEVRSDLSANDSWRTRIENNGKTSGVFADYHYYGTGDTGGAPTDKSVEMVHKSITAKGPVRVISSQADWLFKAISSQMRRQLPRYKGELLLTEHSAGSITSQSYMKRWNRKNELLADAAERAAVVAWWLGAEYPARRLERAWTLVLGSQMHDILPGTSHPKAYEYSWNDEVLAANQFAAVLTDSIGVISSALDTRAKGTAIVVFNPLSTNREDVVEVELPWKGQAPPGMRVIGPDDREVPAQVLEVRDGTLRFAILAAVPSVGFAVFDVKAAERAPATGSLKVAERTLENERYRVTLNDNGDIASIMDKTVSRQLLKEPTRLAFMYEKPRQWPAWNMDWKDRQQPPRSFVEGPAEFRITERGPTRVAIEVARASEGSSFIQTVRLSAGAAGDRVEVHNFVEWNTRERSLKAAFPLTVSNPKATYDIQVGTIERDNNNEKRYENPAHQWFDLTDASGDYGVTVINDSKYGSDKPDDSTLRLTLLYTPGISGDYQDQGTQDIGRHEMVYAVAGHKGGWREAITPWIAARVNQPLRAFIVQPHEGSLGKVFSWAKVSAPGVMIQALKKAEDGDGAIVRLRELTGTQAAGAGLRLSEPIRAAHEFDGQERPLAPATVTEGVLTTDVRGYAMRAFALKLTPPPAKIAKPVSTPIDLPFDADVVSQDSKRDDGSLWNTYPAEQLGASIAGGGTTFKLGDGASGQMNAVLCRGQTIDLPQGDFNRLEILAASVEGDQIETFAIDREQTQALIPSGRGYIGQWDNRAWTGSVPEVAFSWSTPYGGLAPGYIKQAEVAWFSSHHHTPEGDQYYDYCYLFKIGMDVKKGARQLTLPKNENIMVLAATLVKSNHHRATPAGPLFDVLDDRTLDSPLIEPAGGTFNDVTQVRIDPQFYGSTGAIRFTIDGSEPTAGARKFEGPISLNESATVRAAMVGADGSIGPESTAQITIDDRTAPRVLKAVPAFDQPIIRLLLSEPVDQFSVSIGAKYLIDPGVKVKAAEQVGSPDRIMLTLDSPLKPGKLYSLTVRNLKDDSPAKNLMAETVLSITAPSPLYRLGEVPPNQWGKPMPVPALPVKGDSPWTLNMFVRAEKQPENRTVIAGFGALDGTADGGGRYLCKFANGVHFWSRNRDVQGNTPFELGKWQMLTATYDGARLKLYKDAKLLGEREAKLTGEEAVVHVAPVDPWDKKRRFEGQVRELTIWGSALDEDEIASLQKPSPSQ